MLLVESSTALRKLIFKNISKTTLKFLMKVMKVTDKLLTRLWHFQNVFFKLHILEFIFG